MKYLIGIDIGGTATKAVLFDEKGNEMAKRSCRTPVLTPKPGYNERDMTALWETVCICIKKAIEVSGIEPADIAAVGCSGHGKGLYLWGKDDRPAYNAIASTDHRAEQIAKKWCADGTNDRARELNLQNILDCQPAALLAWMKINEKESCRNVKWVFEAKDYIRFMLTGKAYAEITDYSGSGLMNLKTKQIDKKLFEIFGIDEFYDCMPPLKYSCEACGAITKAAAEVTGIPEGVTVCGGMFDIDACAVAMEAHKSRDICVITGTWSINEYVSDDYDKTGIRNSLYCLDGKYLIEESSPTSAGNLEWVIDNFMSLEKAESSGNQDIYERINQMVESVRPEDDDAIFLPFLYGSNENGLDRCVISGLTNMYEKKYILRAVYEGVVFCHMVHLERLLASREEPEYIKLAGGVTNSDVWVQMFADATGIPVLTIETKELGGLGVVEAASVASGIYETLDAACEKMSTPSRIFKPDKAKHTIYMKKFNNYKGIIEKLRNER